ncbi:hypothetical protein HGA64_05015 [Candidatus Falkowbacteria bacterium]|nr:hypothetical protein [Candidatus Falkowbacteria bacterium]
MKQHSNNTFVRFNYLYRDGGNYKKRGFIDFKNPTDIDIDEINRRLKTSFDMGCLFNAKQAGVPEVFLFNDDGYSINVDDIGFHEYDSVEIVDASRMDVNLQGRIILKFLKDIEWQRKKGWKSYDPASVW